MANAWTALNTFWNSFSLSAYDENTVPEDATMPYITFEASVGGIEDNISLNASLYYKGMSWDSICEKTEEISAYIGGGASVLYDNGRLWVTKGTPFSRRMDDPDDFTVRRMLLTINANFQTVT